MTNKTFLQTLVADKVKGNQLQISDFEKLFSSYRQEQQYQLINQLADLGIELVDEFTSMMPTIPTHYAIGTYTNEQLCYLYQRGDQAALETLVLQNQRLLYKRAQRLRGVYNHKLEIEDLVQQGVFGIMKAADGFEVERDLKFLTYAMPWINQVMMRHIVECGFTVRIPQHRFDQLIQLMKIKQAVPDATEVEYRTLLSVKMDKQVSEAEYLNLEQYVAHYLNTTSLDVSVNDADSTTLMDFIECHEESTKPTFQAENNDMTAAIYQVLGRLNERQRRILQLRFGLDGNREHTLDEVGQQFGVTRERIRQIEQKALRTLRKATDLRCYL